MNPFEVATVGSKVLNRVIDEVSEVTVYERSSRRSHRPFASVLEYDVHMDAFGSEIVAKLTVRVVVDSCYLLACRLCIAGRQLELDEKPTDGTPLNVESNAYLTPRT